MPALLGAIPSLPRHEILDLVGSSGHGDCCYVGEVGSVGPACYHRHDRLRQLDVGGKPFQIVPTVEHYTWEGTVLDCSIGEPVTMTLPSTFMQEHAGLSFDLRGPSWLDTAGKPVFTYYTESGSDSTALLVKATFLREFLPVQKLQLVALHWFDRIELTSEHDRKHPQVQVATEARLTPALVVHAGEPRRDEHDLT